MQGRVNLEGLNFLGTKEGGEGEFFYNLKRVKFIQFILLPEGSKLSINSYLILKSCRLIFSSLVF